MKDIKQIHTMLSAYDPNCYGSGNRIEFQLSKDKWIKYGSDNNMNAYIDSLLDMSEDHSAILSKFTDMVVGSGFEIPQEPNALRLFTNQSEKPESRLSQTDYNYLLPYIAKDLLYYGAFALNVVWGKGNKRIAKIEHIDVRSVRLATDHNGYYVSNNWMAIRQTNNKPKYYPAFSDSPDVDASQIMYVKLSNGVSRDYGIPYWFTCRASIEAQQELAIWYVSHLTNSFSTSVRFHYPNGYPLADQLDQENKARMDYYTGPNNLKFMLTQGDLEVVPFDSGRLPEDIPWIASTISERIKVGHGVVGDGMIFGLRRPSGEGITFTNDALNQEWQAFEILRVRPMQAVIEQAFNLLSRGDGDNYKWSINPYVLFDNGGSPIEQATEADQQNQATNV